jgi:3',5'-cyclic AMP phosphodiesterase CpdA
MPGCVPHRSRRPTTDVLIAQLTDPHVMRAGTNRRFMGDTAGHLARAVAWLAARAPRPAAVVVSGDLVDRADPQEYDRLRDVLAGLPMPYYVVPGNHDRSQRVRETFAGHGFAAGDGKLHYTVEDHDVRIVGLDSTLRLRSGARRTGRRCCACIIRRSTRACAIWTRSASSAWPGCTTCSTSTAR